MKDCILIVTDPVLKGILKKDKFKNISELREAFNNLVDAHSVIPLNIQVPTETFSRRKFGKVYREDGKIKAEVVMPGQEFFNQFELGLPTLPTEFKDYNYYGDSDNKVLTFDSLDSFLGFYLANYLYVNETNIGNLVKGINNIIENTVKKLRSETDDRRFHSYRIEDLEFADSLVSYSKLLHQYAGIKEDNLLDELYSRIKEKINKYNKKESDKIKIAEKNESNLKQQVETKPADLFFEAYDVVDGKLNEQPIAQARRQLIRAIQDPTKYRVKLAQGSVDFVQQDNTPTTLIEQGVVGLLVDTEGRQVYLDNNNQLTTDLGSAKQFKYTVDGETKSSPVISLLLSNNVKDLKEEFKKSDNKDSYVFELANVKSTEVESTYKSFKEAGLKIEDVQINILKDDPLAGTTYAIKGGKKVWIDATTLEDWEIDEVVGLLEHTYEDQEVVRQVVEYLNDHISVSQKRITKESTGREISFWEGDGRVLVRPERYREGDKFLTVPKEEQKEILIEENKDLVLKSLKAARVRFRKGEGDVLRTNWDKWQIVFDEPIKTPVRDKEGKKFYEDHIKQIKVSSLTKTQLATYRGRYIPRKNEEKSVVVGQLKVEKGKEYTIGEINQLVMLPLATEPEKTMWLSLYNQVKNPPRVVFADYNLPNPGYYDSSTNRIVIKYSEVQKDSSFLTRGLLEELLHAVTIPRLNQYSDTVEYQQLVQDYEKAKELALTYKDTEQFQKLSEGQKKEMDRLVNYYLQNLEEFVAGISSPYFRAFLRLGESRDKNLLETIIDKVRKILNKILKDVAPSLYTDVTTDIFNFLLNKPIKLVEQVITPVEEAPTTGVQVNTDEEIVTEERKKRTRQRRPEEEVRKFFAPPTQGSIDLDIIRGIDAEIADILFEINRFGDFLLGNVTVAKVWDRFYNRMFDAAESGRETDTERISFANLFLDNEQYYFNEWKSKSGLFVFSNDTININEEELNLDEEEEAEDEEQVEGKDPGYNKVDSEQKYSRLQLADKYAKTFVKLTPSLAGRKKGLTQLTDFTNLWNRLQDRLKNTLSFDEQLEILKDTEVQKLIPQAAVITQRLKELGNDANNNVIVNSFQSSFSTAEVPVYISHLKEIKDKEGNVMGYDHTFFEQGRLDSQNLEIVINQMFRDFAEQFSATTTVEVDGQITNVPTYDNNKLLEFLKKGEKDILNTYRKILPIPELDQEDTDKFLKESSLFNFHNFLTTLLRERANKSHILNGDFVNYIRSKGVWEEFGGKRFQSEGIPTALNKVLSALTKYSPLTVSNMTRNAEGQNQSILLSWSSWLIGLKQFNDSIKVEGKVSYREKNPIFKYSVLNQLQRPITPINISGSRVVSDSSPVKGRVSMNLDYIPYVRQEIANYMITGITEINRAETKNSSFGYKVDWGNNQIHPIKLENFKTDKWVTDMYQIYSGYLKGELERIQQEVSNPVTYYPKYDKIKTDFHLFRYLPDTVKADKELPINEFFAKHGKTVRQSFVDHVNTSVDQFKKDVLKQTGIALTPNHPILNVPKIQSLIKEMGFEQFLKGFLLNREIYEIEHFIISHGDVGQHDKPYKRFGSNISTGVPAVVNGKTLEFLTNTLDRTFTGRIPTGRSFVIPDDIYSYEGVDKLQQDVKTSLALSYKAFGVERTEAQLNEEAAKKAIPYKLDPTVENAKGVNVADGEAFMTPDFGRLLMIATNNWSSEREEGFWFLVIHNKLLNGENVTDEEAKHYNKVNDKIEKEGIYFFFPPEKMQFRGEFVKEGNVAIEGLDKFKLSWLWPSVVRGTKFEPILNKMLEDGLDYGKFESGTKIGTFLPDDLLGQVQRGEVLVVNSDHQIDLTYMKEQVKAPDKFKNKAPMSTQARKLILSNLRNNGEYLSETIKEGVTKWKESQRQISEINRKKLLDEISTDNQIDNKKLADKVKEELKKRELPQSLTDIFNFYGQEYYERFEQALSPQLVETLISSLLKNSIVKPKFPGEHYIQVASPLFDRVKEKIQIKPLRDITPKVNIINYRSITKEDKDKAKDSPEIQERWAKEEIAEMYEAVENYNNNIGTIYDVGEEVLGLFGHVIYYPETKKFFRPYAEDILSVLNSIDFEEQFAIWKEKKTKKGQGGLITKDKIKSLIEDFKISTEERDLRFYRMEGDRVLPADCKIVLSGEFLKLLNLKEVEDNLPDVFDQMNAFEKLEERRRILNDLLLDDNFVERHRKELTVFSSRIPGQGYNSMDIQVVREFLPTYLGPIIVPNPLATKKSGTDYDYDKLPTITPELNKKGLATNSPVNTMIEGASQLILDPINFHRVVTPNTTDEIDPVVSNTLDKLGEQVSEPKFDDIFSFVTHLRKWWAVKQKGSLGIGATNNTFTTLIQDSDTDLNNEFQIADDLVVPINIPFNREDRPLSYPLLSNGLDKLEYVNEFINITVDVASNDAIGYTNLIRDNSAFLLLLNNMGVRFDEAFYFINQPIIIKYHQIVSQQLDKGLSASKARNYAISTLLNIQTEDKGKSRKKEVIYQDVFNLTQGMKIGNLLDSISTKDQVNSTWNTKQQKSYLAFYLIGQEIAGKFRDGQSYNNFDTAPSPNFLFSQARENLGDQIRTTGLFNEGVEKIHTDSVISHLNVHALFQQISAQAFKIKRDTLFTNTAQSLGSYIYDQRDKEKFFKKFDNDYLLAILQTYGSISKESVEKNLKGDLVKRWKQIKNLPEVKDLTITKYVAENYSTKTKWISPTLFLGLDNDAQTLDQIAKDIRLMYQSANHEVRKWAKDFVETGLYTTGFNVSPTYYLKALPSEIVSPYLKEAYDKYQPSQEFINQFADRFMYQRGNEFSQYFMTLYETNVNSKFKKSNFNPEPWRYTDYKLSLIEQEKVEEDWTKPCSTDIPF